MEAGSQITRVTRAQSYIPVENPTQNPTQRQRKIERSKLPQRIARRNGNRSIVESYHNFTEQSRSSVQTNSGRHRIRTCGEIIGKQWAWHSKRCRKRCTRCEGSPAGFRFESRDQCLAEPSRRNPGRHPSNDRRDQVTVAVIKETFTPCTQNRVSPA